MIVAAMISVFAVCQAGLDLPVPPVRIGSPPAYSPPPRIVPDDDEGEDPRDTPPPVFFGEEIDSETDSIVYVIDISCSMDYQIYDGNTPLARPIDKARAELERSISGLSANFEFKVVAYNCGVDAWRGSTVPATKRNKASVAAWIAALRPSGATGTGPAVAVALADRENMSVVLLTDGAPNCGVPEVYGWLATTPGVSPGLRDERFFEAHRELIRRANTQGAVVNVFGIAARRGYRAFCQGVALDSGGSYFDVP